MQPFRIFTGSGPLPAFNLFIAQHCPFVTNCHILRRLLCYFDQIYSLKRRHNALKLHIDVCIRQLKSRQVYFDFVVEIVYKSPMVTLYITVDVFVVMLREVSQDRKKSTTSRKRLSEGRYILFDSEDLDGSIAFDYDVMIDVVQLFTCFRLRWRCCHFPEEPARWKL